MAECLERKYVAVKSCVSKKERERERESLSALGANFTLGHYCVSVVYNNPAETCINFTAKV